jgi:hypothetical protein
MVQKKNTNYVATRDAQIKLSREVCALSTEQRSKDAAAKGAQVLLSREECA